MHGLDWFIVLAYLATLTGIGIYFSRRQTSLDEFFGGGKQVGWLTLGVSLMAALNSGVDYIQAPALVYTFGMVYMAQLLTWIPIYFWVTRVTVPFYHKLDTDTPYEYLERRFGIGVRSIAAAIYVLWRIGWMGVALYVPCLALKAATGGELNVTWIVVVTGLVVTIYTMLGGLKAVVWTDVTQFCVMFGGLSATLAIIIGKVPGGFFEVLRIGRETNRLSLTAQIPGWADADWLGKLSLYLTTEVTFVGVFLCILVGKLTAFTADQVAIQRLQTIKSHRQARNAFVINALSDVVWMLVLGFVGLALFAYFQFETFPEQLQNDKVLPYFMSRVFPTGLMGLVVASIFAASLSSVDAALNSTTSIVVMDFYDRLWLKRSISSSPLSNKEQRHQVFVSRGVNLMLGLTAILIAANVERMGELYTVTNKLLGAFFGGLCGVFLLGMFSKRANGKGVVLGALVGLAASCFLSFFSALTVLHEPFRSLVGSPIVSVLSEISWQWPPVVGLILTLLVGAFASCGGRSTTGPAPLTFYRVVNSDTPKANREQRAK